MWLVAAPDGAVAARRFCRGCAPAGSVDDIECAVCGDGPLLTTDLAAVDLIVSAAIERWLRETGWSATRAHEPCCPRCTRPRRATRRAG